LHLRNIILVILVLILIIACNKKEPIQLQFQPVFKGKKIACDDSFSVKESQWQINALSFYVSKLKINQQKLHVNGLDADTDVSLLGGVCRQSMNWIVNIEDEIKVGGNLSFELAVPFELNHKNPLTAPFPLNQPDMFWAWQLGHKFIRLDMANQTIQGEDWSFHLGSTGCDSASVMRAPKKPCKQPNRFNFNIENFNPDKPIYIHLDRVFNHLPLVNDNNCMGSITSPGCQVIYANLAKNDLFNQRL